MEMIICPWSKDKGEFLSSIRVKLHTVPREGDYIAVRRSNKDPRDPMGTKDRSRFEGTEDFRVQRLCWDVFTDVNGEPLDNHESVTLRIECEMVIADESSDFHRGQAGEGAAEKIKAPF